MVADTVECLRVALGSEADIGNLVRVWSRIGMDPF
jgi:hypothetical protein